MNLTETIRRPTLHEELVDRLRDLVVEDALKPGEKVPEKELCESFGVSRTPLREALKVLASRDENWKTPSRSLPGLNNWPVSWPANTWT